MTVISIPVEIFRRLTAEVTVFYSQNIVRAVLSGETIPTTPQTRSFFDFDEQYRNCLPVLDISRFKRPNYCILCAEYIARSAKR
jgi:hypothetical protein